MDYIIFLIVLAVVFFLFARWVNKLFRRKYSYTVKECIMTIPERNCFNALVKVVERNGGRYWVFPQVHFSAFLNNKVVGQSWKGAFWHINGKSVDFVLCTKESLSPVLAIELDDRSHEREDRRDRDFEEERMFRTARIPLLRLEHKDIDNFDYLETRISEALHPTITPEPVIVLTWYQKLLILIKGVK